MSSGPFVRLVAAGPGPGVPDRDLMARYLAAGDEAAFAALVARHGPMVRGVCRRRLPRPEDAEDAAQAVFLLLARRADRVRNLGSVASWLHGVAVRVSRKAARKAGRAGRPVPPPAGADPADVAAWRDVLRVVDDALARLPDKLRQPVVLCYLHGLTRDEAAARLGLTETTFRGRLDRGRDRLRADLARRGFPLSAGLLATLLTEHAAAVPPVSAEAVAAVALGRAPVPAGVAALVSTGVLTRRLIEVGATLGCLALVGVVGVQMVKTVKEVAGPAAGQPRRPAEGVRPLLAPVPVPPEFLGTWVGVHDRGSAARDTETITFVDGKRFVWRKRTDFPGMHIKHSRRGTYVYRPDETLEIFPSEFEFDGLEGPRPGGGGGALYRTDWQDPGRTAFRLRYADERTYAIVLRKAAPAADAPVPDYLAFINRAIRKEPQYESGSPRYGLLAFGPAAMFRVWVVLDGRALYVDRHGDGDLTDPGDKVAAGPPVPGEGFDLKPDAKTEWLRFAVGDLANHINMSTHTGLVVACLVNKAGETPFVAGAVRVAVDGQRVQRAGPMMDAFLARKPEFATVFPFASPRLTLRPAEGTLWRLEADTAKVFKAELGTPSTTRGGFVRESADNLPAGVHPVAEFEFPADEPDKPSVKLRVPLADREKSQFGVPDQFCATVTVPAGVANTPGKVTLSFPDCPLGPVEPRTYDVLFDQKGKAPRGW